MRFLVDAQLPQRLANFLNDNGHEAIHTFDFPEQNRTSDETIRKRADAEDRIVVTKDEDFVSSHLIRCTPRKVLLVSTGNISNLELLNLVKSNLGTIEKAFEEGVFIEMTRSDLIIHL